jgi:hypothetical protein
MNSFKTISTFRNVTCTKPAQSELALDHWVASPLTAPHVEGVRIVLNSNPCVSRAQAEGAWSFSPVEWHPQLVCFEFSFDGFPIDLLTGSSRWLFLLSKNPSCRVYNLRFVCHVVLSTPMKYCLRFPPNSS